MSPRPLALVTHACSGAGFAVTARLARAGNDVAMSGSSNRVLACARRLHTEHGVEVYPYRGDAATYDGAQGFWDWVRALGRPVDTAVLTVASTEIDGSVDTTRDDLPETSQQTTPEPSTSLTASSNT